MENILKVTLLFDFYSELLTKKQKNIFELYYLNDFSLQEIAEQFGITRQAVRDILKRTVGILNDYEEKLLLLQTYRRQKEKANEIKQMLNEMKNKNIFLYEIGQIEESLTVLFEA